MDAKPETKKANNYALNPKNKDGYDSKWQHSAGLANAATRTNCITCMMVHRAQGQITQRRMPDLWQNDPDVIRHEDQGPRSAPKQHCIN
jgi:hypothetical protein